MKTNFFNYIVILALSFYLFISCSNQTSKSKEIKGRISISGAFALYPLAVKWAEEFQKKYPEVKIDVSAGGAGKGMTDVLNGLVDIAMVSRDINKEETSKGAFEIKVTKDAVIPTANPQNPYIEQIKANGLTKKQFENIFVNKTINTWGKCYDNSNKSSINVYTRSDACGAAEMWAKYLGVKQENLKGTGVYGDPGMAEAVKKDKNGIGFNNIAFLYDAKTRKINQGITIIPLDIDSSGVIETNENFYYNLDSLRNAILQGRYPSPPARNLFFVTKAKPQNNVVVEFLNWVLTDGQKYVEEAGYINIPSDILNKEAKKITK